MLIGLTTNHTTSCMSSGRGRWPDQKGLEGRHGGAAPVEAEGELVKVDLQMLLADAVMSAAEPGLEVAEDPVHTRQNLRRPLRVALDLGAVAVTHALERCVASPAVGQDDRTTLTFAATNPVSEAPDASGTTWRRTLPEPFPRTSTAPTTNALHTSCRPPFEASFGAADVDLIHLNLLLQSFAVGPYHRPPQLVEHGPGRLVGVQAELPLQLQCRETRCVRGDQVRRPEPEGERHSGSVQNRWSHNRGLIAAGLALPEPTPSQLERLGVLAPRAPVPLGPPTRREDVRPGRLPRLRTVAGTLSRTWGSRANPPPYTTHGGLRSRTR